LWRPKAALGLSLGAGGVTAVRVARGENGLRVEGVQSAEFPLDRQPHPAEIEEAIEEATRGLLDDKTRVAANLRSQQAGLHFFELPFDRPEKIKRVLKYTAEPLFLTSVENMILDYMPLPGGGNGDRPGVVFGAGAEAVAQVLEQAGLAGLEPQVILPDRLGLLMAGQQLFRDQSEPRFRLLLDLGAEQTGLALFDADRPVLVRSIFWGGRAVTRALAEDRQMAVFEAEELKRETNLQNDDPEITSVLTQAWQPLLLEIERTVAAAWSEYGLEDPELVLSGGGALTLGLPEFLAGRLGLAVSRLADYTGDNPETALFRTEAACPFGLAVMALKPGYQPNLRQGDLAPRQMFLRHRTPVALMGAGLALVLLLNMGHLVYSYRLEANRAQTIKARMIELYKETVPGATTVVDPLAQLKQQIEMTGGAAFGLAAKGVKVLDLLLDVSRLAGSHKDIRITDLSLGSTNLELQGEGGSFEVIDQLKNELAGLPYFSETTLRGARMDQVTRVLTFKITMKR
jgi:Tfp pilus assembly PilM family ATPase